MQKIFENIWLGNKFEAADTELLKLNGIQAVLNVAIDVDDPVIEGVIQKKVSLYDGYLDGKIPHDLLKECMDFLDSNKDKEILLHCAAGQSRAPSVLIHYMYLKGWDLYISYFFILMKWKIRVHPSLLVNSF